MRFEHGCLRLPLAVSVPTTSTVPFQPQELCQVTSKGSTALCLCFFHTTYTPSDRNSSEHPPVALPVTVQHSMALSVVYPPQGSPVVTAVEYVTSPLRRYPISLPLGHLSDDLIIIQYCRGPWPRWRCHRHMDSSSIRRLLAEGFPTSADP